MIRYLTHELIDKKRWDDCVQQADNGLIFGNSWMLDIAYPGWAGIIAGDYEAVLMIPVKKKMGILYALQPFFIRHAGIYGCSRPDDEKMNAMLEAIPSTLRWIKLFTYPVKIIPGSGWTSSARHYQRLDLSYAYPELASRFSTNTKRNIKKAEKHGLQVKSASDPSIVTDLFRRFKGAELEIFSEKSYATLLSIMHACIEKNAGETYIVNDPHGNVLAAAFFCSFRDTLTFLKGAATDEGKATGAMPFLFSHVIEKNAGKMHYLDFGGSNIESVARFYKSFGGEDQEYLQLEKNKLPGVIRMIRSMKS